MKTAAKVFIIIGMVVGFWWVCPIVFGIIALNKLNNVKEKSELTATSVLTLIFCSVLGGIFMLCIPESDFPGKEETPAFNPYQQAPQQNVQYQPTAIPSARPQYTPPAQPQYVPQAQPQQPQYVPQAQPQQPQYVAPQAQPQQPQYVPPVQPQQNAPQQQAPYYPPQNNG